MEIVAEMQTKQKDWQKKSGKKKTQNKWQENKNYESSRDERKKEGIKEIKSWEIMFYSMKVNSKMCGGKNNFTGKYNLPQMTPVQIESINKAVSLGKKVWNAVKGLHHKKHQSQKNSTKSF